MGELGRRWRVLVPVLGGLVVLATLDTAPAATNPRVVLIVPFDTTALSPEDRWMGEAVAQVLKLGLTEHPAIVIVDRARLRAFGQPEAWGEAVVAQAARTLRVDTALFGGIARKAGETVVDPRLLRLRATSSESVSLEPLTIPAGEFHTRLASLPVSYARTLRVPVTDAEATRMGRVARPTRSLHAFELYTRGQLAARRADQEGRESAVDLLSRAIEADPNFVMAQYSLGLVHRALGNRWKAAAQFRASTQLDATYPEPYKALGDLFLAAPRRLFDQAVDAYGKAIELRPFYADAHVGLGDAKAAKGDIDGAIGAYQKALVYNPVNPRVHRSLGKIYYGEKGLYYEAVSAYKRAIELDPQAVEARMGLGEVYEDKGLYREALDEYQKVIELDNRHTGALYNLALVYEKVDPREAIVQWERYIAIASQLPAEKDWVDIARQHLRKLQNQLKDQ